jgi:hypothetical protein
VGELNPFNAGARKPCFSRVLVARYCPSALRFVQFPTPIPTLPDRLESRFHTSTFAFFLLC